MIDSEQYTMSSNSEPKLYTIKELCEEAAKRVETGDIDCFLCKWNRDCGFICDDHNSILETLERKAIEEYKKEQKILNKRKAELQKENKARRRLNF